jgi:hypothetical protein
VNTRAGFAPPNIETEPVVEVPAVGTVLVEEGEQYAVRAVQTEWHTCDCANGTHPDYPYGLTAVRFGGRSGAELHAAQHGRHVVPVHTYTVVGEVRA